jgi:hypothetical protein
MTSQFGPSLLKEHNMPNYRKSLLFVGADAMLLVDRTPNHPDFGPAFAKPELYPREESASSQWPPPTIPESIGHEKEWLAACMTGSPTLCNFDYSGPLTETVLLGTVAYRAGLKLEWDPVNLRVTNCPEADRFIRREYRQGWTLWSGAGLPIKKRQTAHGRVNIGSWIPGRTRCSLRPPGRTRIAGENPETTSRVGCHDFKRPEP